MLKMHAVFKLRPIRTAKYAITILFTLYLFIENSSTLVPFNHSGPSWEALMISISGIQIIERRRNRQKCINETHYNKSNKQHTDCQVVTNPQQNINV